MPFFTSYFPCDGQNGTRSSKNNGKENKFYNFLTVCSHVEKKSADNFIANRNFTSCYNIKILNTLQENVLFSYQL